jgi:hypothetical protein
MRRPLASASACIFVLRPPRERPTACFCSPFSARRRAMRLPQARSIPPCRQASKVKVDGSPELSANLRTSFATWFGRNGSVPPPVTRVSPKKLRNCAISVSLRRNAAISAPPPFTLVRFALLVCPNVRSITRDCKKEVEDSSKMDSTPARGTVTGRRNSRTRLRVSCHPSRTSEHSSVGAAKRRESARMFG